MVVTVGLVCSVSDLSPGAELALTFTALMALLAPLLVALKVATSAATETMEQVDDVATGETADFVANPAARDDGT